MLRNLTLEPSGVVSYLGIVDLPNGTKSEWEVAIPPAVTVAHPWENRAKVLSALGHSRRLKLVRQVLGSSQPTVELNPDGADRSHITTLVRAGWLTRVQGNRYKVPGARTLPLLAIIMAASPE